MIWVILRSQTLCPLIQLWKQELPNYPSSLSLCDCRVVCFWAKLFLVAAKGQGYSRCTLLVVNRSLVRCTLVISMMTGGVRTHRKNECAGLSSQAPVAPHCSGSRMASGFLCQAPAFGFGLFWKENRYFWLTMKTAASSFAVVLMLMSSGRVITHFLNLKLVTKLSDFSTSRKEMKHFKFLPEIKPTDLSRERPKMPPCQGLLCNSF